MKVKKLLGIIASLLTMLAFTGCSIKQEVKPIKTELIKKEICIIKNEKIRDSFLQSYKNALESKNYKVTILPDRSLDKECYLTSTYTANWRWDLALYLAYTKLSVFEKDTLIAEAVYDALNGSGNMNKFINADEKIQELVNQLYP